MTIESWGISIMLRNTVAVGILAVILGQIVSAAEPSPRKAVNAEQLHTWLQDLNHAEFTVRETAAQRLIATGPPALPIVLSGLEKSPAETSWRCAEILERIALEGDEATLERVAQGLKEISAKGNRSFDRLAEELRQRQKAFRHDRAIALFRKQGGKIGAEFESDLFGFVPVGAAEIEVEFAPDEPIGEPIPDLPGPVVPEDEDDTPHEAPLPPAEEERPAVAAKPAQPLAEDLPPLKLPELPEIEDEPIRIGAVEIVPGEVLDVEAGGMILGGGFESVFSDDALSGGTMQLGANWKGGDAGLSVIRELQEVVSLSIDDAPLTDAAFEHIAELKQLKHIDLQGTNITSAGLRAFRTKRSDVSIMAKGPAMMGVSANWQQSGCTLNHVFPASGAADAGLREGDEVLEINGQAIRDFTDLTISVFASKPGDKIKVKYRRGNETDRTAEVVLRARRE